MHLYFLRGSSKSPFNPHPGRILFPQTSSPITFAHVLCEPSISIFFQSMKSPVVKRSIVIAGHKTSVSLEDAFWRGLKEIAGDRDITLSDLVASIDTDRRHGNLSSAIRLFVLDYYRAQSSAAAEGNASRDMIGMRATPSVLRAD